MFIFCILGGVGTYYGPANKEVLESLLGDIGWTFNDRLEKWESLDKSRHGVILPLVPIDKYLLSP